MSKLAPVAPPKGTMIPEERSAFDDLVAARQTCSRESQKAKVKELLFKWHPDKNPSDTDKATRVFQFVQREKERILGL